MLLVEDVHLADADSLALVALLARLGELPMLIVVTMRPLRGRPGARPRAAARADGVRRARARCVDLEPLDRHEVQALAGAALGAVPDGARGRRRVRAQRRQPVLRARDAARAPVARRAARRGRARAPAAAATRLHAPNPPLLDRVFGRGDEALELAKVVARSAASRCATCRWRRGSSGRRTRPRSARRSTGSCATTCSCATPRAATSSRTRSCATRSTRTSARPSAAGCTARSRAELAGDRRSGATLDIAELATHVAESADPGDEWAVEVLLEAGAHGERDGAAGGRRALPPRDRAAAAPTRRGAPPRWPCGRGRCTSARGRSTRRRPGARRSTGLPAGAAAPRRRSRSSSTASTSAGASPRRSRSSRPSWRRAAPGCPLLAQRVHLLFSAGRPDDAARAAARGAGRARARREPATQIVAAIHLAVYAWDAGDIGAGRAACTALLEAWAETGPAARRMLAHETIALRRPAAGHRRVDRAPPRRRRGGCAPNPALPSDRRHGRDRAGRTCTSCAASGTRRSSCCARSASTSSSAA